MMLCWSFLANPDAVADIAIEVASCARKLQSRIHFDTIFFEKALDD